MDELACRRPDAGRWWLWYLGDNSERLLDLATIQNADDTIFPVGEAVNAISARVRGELIDLDAQLASSRFPLAWAASDLAERNPLTSDVCVGICRALALVEAARNGGSHLVIVDDADFGEALAELCRSAGIAAQWRGARRGRLGRMASVLRVHWGFLNSWREQCRAARRWMSTSFGSGQPDVVLMTWMDHRTFAAPDALRVDRFFGGLSAWLRESGRRLGWVGNVLGSASRIIDAANAIPSEPVWLTSNLFGPASLVRSYCGLVAFPFALRRRLVVGGLDVTPLIRWARGLELMSSRLVSAGLYFGLASGLRRLGVAPRALFYTYENQPWEKVMLAGFRRALPSTILVGVQHAPFARQYLSAHPSRRQWQDGTTPDLLVTIGEEFRERLIACGAPPERVLVGGALRYPGILAERNGGRVREPRDARRVLVACSIDLQEAIELTHKAAIATAGLAGVDLIVNFHPMVDDSFRMTLRERMSNAADSRHVSFVDDNADAWLGKVDVVLYNASGTSFEAVAAGVPAIFVGSDIALDMDKMAGQGAMTCRSAAELRACIVELLDDAGLRQRCVEMGRNFLARCFTAPAPEFWTGLAARAAEGRLS